MAKSERAFTLIELLLYVAIFAVVAGFFTSILLITLRVQNTQTGIVEVSTQLNFALSRVQQYIQGSTAITSPASGASANSLSVTGGSSGAITIALGTCGGVSNAICVTDSSGTNPLTSSKIAVTNLNFTHYTTASNNPVTPGTETVQISVTATNNTTDPAKLVTRTLQAAASPLNQ